MSDLESLPTLRPDNARATLARRVLRLAGYWFNLIAQPVIAVGLIILLVYLFGYAQRQFNWFNDAETSIAQDDGDSDKLYACSMLCVFVKAPGRCAVCGMELQQVDVPGDPKDIFGVTIDPASRRLANIETVPALKQPISRVIDVLGKVSYDETTEATISAYVDGRVEDLMVDYTGARVSAGQELAILYSPDLYADQIGLLSAKDSLEKSSTNNPRVQQTNQRLYESAKQRLVELGVPASEIDAIEMRGKADRRMRIVAPKSGTVVKKLVEEGQYIKTGMPILKIADLSKVWLMLEMYPEDVSLLKIGQSVTVSMQSQAGQAFEGRIAFVDPMVNEKTQAVQVRVEVPNEAGLIRIGDFGKASIELTSEVDGQVVVPRDAVLINGDDSVAYVETKPGRFEFRKVTIARFAGDQIALSSGIEPGEMVAASGVFMLDSTFNIRGKVSLIDPNRAGPQNEAQLTQEEAEAKEIKESFADLSPADRKLAEQQVICPVTEVKLGAMGMGTPINVDVGGTPIMICCEGCRDMLLEAPEKHRTILEAYHSQQPAGQ